jgi:hypothetical protein
LNVNTLTVLGAAAAGRRKTGEMETFTYGNLIHRNLQQAVPVGEWRRDYGNPNQ